MSERASQGEHDEEEAWAQEGTNSPGDQQRDSLTGSSEDQQSVEDAECPSCQVRGVLPLPCGHKLCPGCMELSRAEEGPTGCIICYGLQLMDSALHALFEALLQGQPRRAVEGSAGAAEEGGGGMGGCGSVNREELCMEHEEMLSVFCLEDGTPLCWQCQADKHEEHQCCSIQEAILDCKVRHKTHQRHSLQELGVAAYIKDTTTHYLHKSFLYIRVL